MSFPSYPEYKESGLERLGFVPIHWALYSLKRSVEGCVNGIWGDEADGENDLAVIRVADFQRSKLRIGTKKLTYRSITNKEKEARKLRIGDLLIEKSGGGDKTLVGCVVLFEHDFGAVSSNFVARMRPLPNFDSNFLCYAFDSLYKGRVNYPSIKQTTGIQNLDSESYLQERFCFPSLTEQTKIARFLDHETAKIDTLIHEQKRLIELLKEKRQAVISHAVTKGLDPDVPMKDSGVKWLGGVPAHWGVVRLKHVKSRESNAFVDGPFGSNLKSEHFVSKGGAYVIESNFATTGRLTETSLKQITAEHFQTIQRSSTKAGDIIIAKIGARYGMCSILPALNKPAVVSGNSMKLTIDEKACESNFALLVLGYLRERGAIEDIVNMTAQPALSLGEMNNLPFPLPPLAEQIELVRSINEKVTAFEQLSEECSKLIVIS